MFKNKTTSFFVSFCFSLAIYCLLFTAYCFNLYAASIDEAYRHYFLGAYEEALNEVEHLEENEQSLYFTALIYMKSGQYDLAGKYFEKIISQYPSSKKLDFYIFRTADVYFLREAYYKAREIYKKLEAKSDRLNFTPMIYLRLAQVSAKQGNWSDKRKYIGLIKSKYPSSAEADYAKILEGYDDFFTIQCGAFAERANAAAMASDIREYYPAYIVEETKNGTTFYKVRVGRYRIRSDAKRIFLRLIDKGFPAKIYP